MAPAASPASQEPMRCTACASGVLARQEVRSAFWQGDRLVVVEGIPALVCQSCGEQFYEDETAMKLDLMRGGSCATARAARTLTVPVFDFDAAKKETSEGSDGSQS
ncbi:MAG: type II toxin-antitoxin system MqsA family antitoxin [Rhodobacter sp.]|nr:type II toxin-antitoxin system MqsA family antitoxin [Rhodobacter sp.]